MEHHVDPWLGIIFPYINFFLFLAAAIYFFRKPGRDAALKRQADFNRSAEEAKAAREVAVARLDELKRRQAGLDREIQELKGAGQASAQVEARKIVEDAERLAAHLKEEAHRIATTEVEKARTALRAEIVAAVKGGVVAKIQREVGPDAQLTLVRKQIGELRSIQAEG